MELQYRAVRERIVELDCVTIQPETKSNEPVAATALGVFCHGFGAGGDDLVGLAGELLQTAPTSRPIKLVFPAAPISLADEGMPGGRAWWRLSIQSLLSAMEEGRFEQIRESVPPGIDEARNMLVDTIATSLAAESLDETRLLLGGFSQGAMLSVDTACRGLAQPPAQLCLYSGALVCEKLWRPAAERLSSARILQSHGTMDPILPLQTGKWLCEMLQEAACQVDFVQFAGPHTIPAAAIEKTALMLGRLAESRAG